MQHRIRAAALIISDNRILLVEHRHPKTGKVWWVPPGGGSENGESILDCVRREVFEETGLSIEPERVVYLKEFVDLEFERHNLEIFLTVSRCSGTLTIKNNIGIDADYIQSARFLRREDLKDITVFPELLKDVFWDDLGKGFPETKYLGIQTA